MFHIGQFPYVCLVTTPIFCSFSWPRQFWTFSSQPEKNELDRPTWKQKLVSILLTIYVSIQLFLPYSHGLTQVKKNNSDSIVIFINFFRDIIIGRTGFMDILGT